MIDPDDDIDTREPDTWGAGTWWAITSAMRVAVIAVCLSVFLLAMWAALT